MQGLTEFLPVSSSGHLVLMGDRLGLEPDLLFDVVVHVATLAATLVFYRASLFTMARQIMGAVGDLKKHSFGEVMARHPEARFFLLILLGTVPTGIIGLTFKDQLEGLFAIPRAVAGMLLVTAALLIVTRFVPAGQRQVSGMRIRDVLVIGIAQGFAIIPGISRSGTTIACAMFLGIERELAARFSFLLSIPAILGALVLQLRHFGSGAPIDLTNVGVGFAAAALVGLGALALLIPLVRGGKLHYFAGYLVLAGAAGLWLL